MGTAIDSTTGLEGVDTSINLLRANARHLIAMLTSSGQRVEDAVVRGHVAEIVHIIGEGLAAANANLAAITALVDANQRALATAVLIAEYANVAVDNVVAMQPTQQ